MEKGLKSRTGSARACPAGWFGPLEASCGARPSASRGGGEGAAAGKRQAAFTLIELLVVISIISMLVAIMVPVVSMAIRKAEDSRCRARVQELADGCMNYYHENNEYYPGQRYPGMLAGSDPAGALTGSEVLAKSLFTDETVPQPYSKYAQVKPEEDLIEIDGVANSISDRTGRPMAVLYYPARLGQSGTGKDPNYGDDHFNEYKYGDNDAYSGKQAAVAWNFRDFITDKRFDNDLPDLTNDRPYAPGAFLIIAAGVDRKYFTPDDVRYPQWGQ